MGKWLTRAEALQALGVRPQTLYAYASRGQIGACRDPGNPRRSLYRSEDVIALVERRDRGKRPDLIAASGEDRHALGLARIEAHYFRSNRFTPEDKLLRDVHRIRHLPAVIVQGRYDIVCPVISADALHRAWPEADYRIVPDAGHSAMEPGIRAALIQATERFKEYR